MPAPLALCLEHLDPSPRQERYLRCVARVGRAPGLRVDNAGEVRWERDGDTAFELWVSGDDRLILYRTSGAVTVIVSRSGRYLDVPKEKPVVIRDKDVVEVAGRRFRLHVHGTAPSVSPPSPLRSKGRRAAQVAAAFAISAAVASGCGPTIEVRPEPPVVAPPDEEPTEEPTQPPPEPPPPVIEEPIPQEPDPIEIREDPPDMMDGRRGK